jgi:hypothetical protein
VQEGDAAHRGEVGQAELQRWLRFGDLVGVEGVEASVDGAHQARRACCPLVLAGAFGWSPSGLEAVLCGRQVVGESGLLDLVAFVGLFPANSFACASFEVAGVAVAVEAWASVDAGVEVEMWVATSASSARSWLTSTTPLLVERRASVRNSRPCWSRWLVGSSRSRKSWCAPRRQARRTR